MNISKSFPQAVLSAGLASYLQASSRVGVAGPGLEGGQVAVLRLYAVVCGYVTITPYSPNRASVSLNCSIYSTLQ